MVMARCQLYVIRRERARKMNEVRSRSGLTVLSIITPVLINRNKICKLHKIKDSVSTFFRDYPKVWSFVQFSNRFPCFDQWLYFVL